MGDSRCKFAIFVQDIFANLSREFRTVFNCVWGEEVIMELRVDVDDMFDVSCCGGGDRASGQEGVRDKEGLWG